MRFYKFIKEREDDPLCSEYAEIASKMRKFPVANYDKPTIESAIRRYKRSKGEFFDQVKFDTVWEQYLKANIEERVEGFLGFRRDILQK